MTCQHFPDDQTLRLQTGAGEDDIIYLPSGLDSVDCERQEEEEEGRYQRKTLFVVDVSINCTTDRNWPTKVPDTWKQSFQPPYHFIVLPRAFHSIFFHLIVFFIEKNVFVLVLKIAYSNTRIQAHSQAVVLLVVVLQVRRILLSSNTSSKANYGLCAETGKTTAAMANLNGFTKSTEF